ncbi:MAG: methyltransferase domain-containing protein [Actinobacteria bacterium]|nr:methyltransferase domain-containing protein [Actinomycetota bacterium]
MATPEHEQIEAWRAAAAGWERQAALLRSGTRELDERLVALLDPVPGETVLELAAGPGDTGFLAAARLRPDGRLLSTDAAPEMVDAARRRAAELGVENAEFRVEDASAIDLPDAAVDAVICRFGIMLVPDPARALAEIARVLRPKGRAVLAVWAASDANDWMTAAGRSAVELGFMERPDPNAPGPFRLADPDELRGLVTGAGLRIATLEEVRILWRAGSLDGWWQTAQDLSQMLSNLLESLTPEEGQSVLDGAERRLARYAEADGSLEVPGLARALLAVRD